MKSVSLSILLGLILLPTSITLGQEKGEDDGPVGIFQSRDEYHQFMGEAKSAAYGENGNRELQAIIPMLNDIVLNQPVGSTASQYGIEASTLGLLSDPDVRAELEMVDDQYNELKNANREIQRRAATQLKSIDFKDSDNLMEQIQAIRESANNELNAVLLPHQLDRLRQIRMQSQLQRRSLVEILTSDPVKTDLDITDRQSDNLREAERQIEEDLAREIANLREKARDRLLSNLNPNQKAEVKEMIGDAFDFKEPEKGKRSKGEKVKDTRTKDREIKGKGKL